MEQKTSVHIPPRRGPAPEVQFTMRSQVLLWHSETGHTNLKLKTCHKPEPSCPRQFLQWAREEREKNKSHISHGHLDLFSEQRSWRIYCPFRAHQKYSKASLSQQRQNFKIYFISMNFQLGGARSNWFLRRQKHSLRNSLSWSYYTSITDNIFCPRVGGCIGSCL